jgi:membrane protease subunit HflC
MPTALRSLGLALAALAVFIVFRLCTYTVGESETVILTQFGKPVGQPVTRAGLHFRVPFIQTVNRIDKRILEWDGRANEMPTRDKLYVVVDTFGRWRISDPLAYFVTLRDRRSALSRLDDILGSEVRNAVAKHDLIEMIRTDKERKPVLDETIVEATGANPLPAIKFGRTAIEHEVVEEAAPKLKQFGLELLDIRFMRINYNPRVTEKIFERMISERQQIASRFRSEGEGEAAKIMGTKERDLLEIDSESYKQVQKIRGESEAKATAIYTAAYNTDPAAAEFYQFLRTMETYPEVLDKGSTLILSTDSDLLRFLKNSSPAKPAPKRVLPEPALPPPSLPVPATPQVN